MRSDRHNGPESARKEGTMGVFSIDREAAARTQAERVARKDEKAAQKAQKQYEHVDPLAEKRHLRGSS